MILILLLIALVNSCENKLYNKHEYLFCNNIQSFYNANKYCIDKNGYLLIINDINENNWIYNMKLNNSWIGYINNTILCPYLENNNIIYTNECNTSYEYICEIEIKYTQPNSSAMILTNSEDTSNYIPIYIGLIAPLTSIILIINIIIKIKEFKKFKKSSSSSTS